MIRDYQGVPVLGIVAWSGTGKTTLLVRLIPLLRAEGLRLALIKHAHHRFDIDHPGKDSYELRKAGADQIVLGSRERLAVVRERQLPDPHLEEMLALVDPKAADLILVEGFKHEPLPKIELHRPALGRPLLFPDDPDIIAVASDAPLSRTTTLPLLDLNDPAAVARFVVERVVQGAAASGSLCHSG